MIPEYIVTAANDVPWQPSDLTNGVSLKKLGTVNGWTMELYLFAPNTSYPDHIHEDPEFVYILDGNVTRDGDFLGPGFASAGETGTIDKGFRSGEEGCTFLTVYRASQYLDK